MVPEPSKRFEQVTYAIRDVVAPARELVRQGHDVLNLNIGDPCVFDFEPPDELLAAFREGAADGRYADSEGVPAAREAIAAYEAQRGITIDADRIVTTNGVSEGLALVAASILDPGDELLIPGPTYPPYVSVPPIVGAGVREYACTPEDGWVPDPDVVRASINERTRGLVVISPNNPTGAVMPPNVLEQIASIAWEHDLYLIADDMYWELSWPDRPVSAGSLSGGPVVVLNGLSKSWLVPGWRAGYIGLSDADGQLDTLYETIMKQARLRLAASTPVQHAIAACLRPDAPHFEPLRAKLTTRAELVADRVAETDALDMVPPSGAFYGFIRIVEPGGRTDKQWTLDLLHAEKVLTVPGSGFGQAGSGHFRMVFLPPEDVLNDAMDRIIRFAEAKA